jgi:hypothetical protein
MLRYLAILAGYAAVDRHIGLAGAAAARSDL